VASCFIKQIYLLLPSCSYLLNNIVDYTRYMHATYYLRGDISSKDDESTTIKIALLEGDLKLR